MLPKLLQMKSRSVSNTATDTYNLHLKLVLENIMLAYDQITAASQRTQGVEI